MRAISEALHRKIDSGILLGADMHKVRISFPEKVGGTTYLDMINSYTISRDETTLAATLSLEILNVNPNNLLDSGYYTSYRNYTNKISNEWANIIVPGKIIKVEEGIGTEMVTQFYGFIDDVTDSVEPGNFIINIRARDYLGKCLDNMCINHTETDIEESLYLEYPVPNTYDYYWLDGTRHAQMTYDNNAKTVTAILDPTAHYGSEYDSWYFNLYTNTAGTYINTQSWQGVLTNHTYLGSHAFTVTVDADYYVEVFAKYNGTWYPDNGTGATPNNNVAGWNNKPDDITDIVHDLTRRSGVPELFINMPTLSKITNYFEFEKMKYGDATNQLKNLSVFDYWANNSGVVQFNAMQNRNTVRTGTRTLTAYTLCTTFNYQIAFGSANITVKNTGNTITYTYNVDYEVDYYANAIKRKVGSTITSGQSVNITYTNCDFIFMNGLNIYKCDVARDLTNVFGTSIFYGDGVGPVVRTIPSGILWDGAVVGLDKVQIYDEINENLDELTKLDAYADRKYNDMLQRYIKLEIDVIAVPWLELGDLIQVWVEGQVYEIYKIISINESYTPESGISMQIKAVHYLYSPI